MVINISKLLTKYFKGSILDLVKYCLCLSDLFYFSTTYIDGPKILSILSIYLILKLSFFFLVVIWEEKVSGNRTKRSRRSLCIKHRDSFLKNKFAMLSDFAESGFNLVISCVFQ